MERKPVNIHNRSALNGGLVKRIQMINAQTEQKSKARGEAIVIGLIDEAKALRSATRRYNQHTGNTSNFARPHQGEKECARRRRQMAAGQI